MSNAVAQFINRNIILEPDGISRTDALEMYNGKLMFPVEEKPSISLVLQYLKYI